MKESVMTETYKCRILGHIVSSKGVTTDPEQERAIENFPIPKILN